MVLYSEWTSLTKTLSFQLAFWSVYSLFLISYLLIAGLRKARTSDGRRLKGSMLSHGNAWIPVLIWVIIAGLFYIILLNPLWIKIFGN